MSATACTSRPTYLRVPLIQRTHLLRTLATVLEADGPQIALLAAPAGFGKTTLVTQFSEEVAAGGAAVAWADLEVAGNSARAMWRVVLSALATASPVETAPQLGLTTIQRRPEDRLFEQLQGILSDLPSPTVLVLDDLQVLSDPAALIQLSLLIRRLPPWVRIVLSSRHDPDISLHEAQLAGRLVELRARDLAFTPAETEQLLAPGGLGADDVASVTELTEGWPAGVQLARILLKQPGDGKRLAALFNAQSSILADYLFQAAFTSQDPPSQELLMRTSVVSEISDGLAGALTGRSDAGEAIAEIPDLAPLLSRYGAPGTAEVRYRYHPLLRAYLVSELARRDQILLRATHRSAAEWYERHDEQLQAIVHAKASEDTELLDTFLRRYAAAMINVGESDSLLQALAGSHLMPTAWELAIGACAALRCGDATAAARWLAYPVAETRPADTRLGRLRFSVEVELAGLNGSARLLHDAPDLEPERPLLVDDVELLITLNRSTAALGAADDGAERHLSTALELAMALGQPGAELRARIVQAATTLGRGHFATAEEQVSTARARNAELGGAEETSLGLLDIVAAWVAYERLDDASARRLLDAGHVETDHATDAVAVTAQRFAWLLDRALDPEPVRFAVAEPHPRDQLSTGLPTALRVIAAFMELRAGLGVGRLDRVRQALDHASSVLGHSGDVVTMQAMLLTAERRSELAHQILQPVVDGRTGCRAATSLVEALVLATTHALRSQHPYEAFSYLERALSTAQACGSYRPLVEAPPEVHASMADQADRLAAHREVVDTVLAYARGGTNHAQPVSPLTARELDILRELPTLNRVDEIAGDLLISTNTVKTHIRGIYRKLGVRSRKEAVVVARQRGLL